MLGKKKTLDGAAAQENKSTTPRENYFRAAHKAANNPHSKVLIDGRTRHLANPWSVARSTAYIQLSAEKEYKVYIASVVSKPVSC